MADPADLENFARTFQLFLDQLVQHRSAPKDNELTRRLREHLGADPLSLPVAQATWAAYDLVNVDRALSAAFDRGGRSAELIGVGLQYHHVEGLSGLVEAAVRHRAADVGPVIRQTVSVSPDMAESVVSAGLYLAVLESAPVAVLLTGADPRRGFDGVSVEVLCADPAAADSLLAEVHDIAIELSVFRGQVLSFDTSGFGPEVGPIRFHRRPALRRDDVVLPDEVLDLIERQVVGVAEHREKLRASGQHLKRGVLLHGPPGTGKTLTVRYLLSRLPGFTVVLLAGQSLRFIGVACALARLLQPALVVLEDCDLVAEDRSMAMGPQPLLFDVLNELDGMAEDADVAFLLTTNRADLLEPALAERPGRVDQAVEIGLPGEDARRALFALYSRGMTVSGDVDVDAMVAATAGTTASFLKELARRAALLSATEAPGSAFRVPVGGPVEIANRHVAAALDELSRGQSALTRRLLGVGDVATMDETIDATIDTAIDQDGPR